MPGNGKPFEIIAKRSKSFRAKRSKSFRKKWIRNQTIPFPFSLFPDKSLFTAAAVHFRF